LALASSCGDPAHPAVCVGSTLGCVVDSALLMRARLTVTVTVSCPTRRGVRRHTLRAVIGHAAARMVASRYVSMSSYGSSALARQVPWPRPASSPVAHCADDVTGDRRRNCHFCITFRDWRRDIRCLRAAMQMQMLVEVNPRQSVARACPERGGVHASTQRQGSEHAMDWIVTGSASEPGCSAS
jgi:hypothetical protein